MVAHPVALLSYILISTLTPGPSNIVSASMGVLHGYRKTLKVQLTPHSPRANITPNFYNLSPVAKERRPLPVQAPGIREPQNDDE
jgi:hypothetical protein